MISLGTPDWTTFDRGIQKEWLVTNGLGGFASSTVIGANTRRYHGLLIAALTPPTGRTLLLSKLEEELTVGLSRFQLSTNSYGGVVHPRGFEHQVEFSPSPFPTFLYRVPGALIEKTVYMPHGANTTIVRYRNLLGGVGVSLRLLPLVNCRDYHHTLRQNDWPFRQETWPSGDGVSIDAYQGSPTISMFVHGSSYSTGGVWYYGMEYAVEKERGLDCVEDHFNPGFFDIALTGSDPVYFIVSTGDAAVLDPEAVLLDEVARRTELAHRAVSADERLSGDPWVGSLAIAADDFIVSRGASGGSTVIAGYPWFTDWGRDTMIALTGLTLVTGRFDEARSILLTFVEHMWDGLMPNRFPDEEGPPAYNTVDASLWFFYSCSRYLEYTGDREFIAKTALPAMLEIIRNYQSGTHYGIRCDYDGLVEAGAPGLQLTWMDAKVGDYVVTPRHGKAVEVNALWYNALLTAAAFCREFAVPGYTDLTTAAEAMRNSFDRVFWNPERGYLNDVVHDGLVDDSLRPNQLLAVSLPYPLLDRGRSRMVVDAVLDHLYIGTGVRSLSPGSDGYKGRYVGGPTERDHAYHQGTAWSWLLGPLISAVVRAWGGPGEGRKLASLLLEPSWSHLCTAGLGQVSEIFDGDFPYTPRGCIAQAWGVGELLRSYVEDVLGVVPQQSARTRTEVTSRCEITPSGHLTSCPVSLRSRVE